MRKSKLLQILSIVILLFVMAGCINKINFQKSTVVPAAAIAVKIDQDKNDNYEITVAVENLAPPEALTPAKESYVVWIESEQGDFNIGQLSIDKDLSGSMSGSTPYKPSRIKITAEDNPKATQPGSQVVLISEEI